MTDPVRIDKWLWAARFFKTRTLATHAVELGRVQQNQLRVKPAHSIKIGDILTIQHADQQWTVTVLHLSDVRGSASVAQTLYQETEESLQLRAKAALDKKYFREPSASLSGRPTKRVRRQLDFSRG